MSRAQKLLDICADENITVKKTTAEQLDAFANSSVNGGIALKFRDKKEWINKANLLFILTAARNTALGTQHHDPKEVCEIFDAIIDLIHSLDTEAEQQVIQSGKARKCICCQEHITAETYDFCTRGISVSIPLCEECREKEIIRNSLLCVPFIVAAQNVKKDAKQEYLKHIQSEDAQGD